jgi:septal ring-binding cell division protein DamX
VAAVPLPERAEPSEEVVIAPAQIRAGQSWVQQMPAGTFLVQHVIVPSYTEANQWMQAHSNLKRARLVAFYLPNDSITQYCVVSGPFESLAQAAAYVQNPNVPRGSQVRSARYMKEQFTSESANAYAEKRQENRR